MPGPAIVKATLIFQTNSYGWSESFLWDGLSSNDLNPHMATLQTIAQARAALLGAQSFIKAQRVSYETDALGNAVPGDSLLKYVRYNGATVPGSDDQDTGVLVTFRNLVARFRRNMFLRGIWDDVNSAGGFYLPSIAGWATAFNTWAALMIAKPTGWWHYSRSAGVPLETYGVDDNGIVTVTAAAAAFGSGPYKPIRVRFSGVNGKSALNGEWVGTPTSPTDIVLKTKMALLPSQSTGTIYTYTRSLEVAASVDSQKITTRRAGAPLLQSRGRQRGKVRT